jgi:hypothetical protein
VHVQPDGGVTSHDASSWTGLGLSPCGFSHAPCESPRRSGNGSRWRPWRRLSPLDTMRFSAAAGVVCTSACTGVRDAAWRPRGCAGTPTV